MKKLFTVLTFLVMTALLVACSGSAPAASQPAPAADAGAAPAAAPASAPNTLTAIKVDATSLDLNADYWSKAPVLSLDTKAAKEGNPDGPTVMLQAVYDGDTIAIRGEWADPTESMKNAWQWDGTAFSKVKGDEDRLMLVFPIQNNAEFASKGCAAACHNTSDNEAEWWMGSEDPALTYDAWHGKSNRSYPAGYVDDKWWSVLKDPADPGSSRPGDAKESGGEKANVTEDGTGPMYMSPDGPGAKFIMAADAVPVDTSLLSAGDIIPGYILAKSVGSRGDIEANALWADGKWVVVMRRALDTGHEDDVTLVPPKPVPFGAAVVDNGGGLMHTIAPDVLTLEWK